MAEKNSAKSEKKDGEDLTTVLDSSQRADLTLLIADITESMRNLILNNFDAAAGLDQGFLPKEGLTEDEKMMAADPNTDLSQYEKVKKLKQEYEKDLATQKMKNLKKNSLKAYDEWREQVIERVGKVVNSKGTAKEQIDKSTTSDTRPKAPTTTAKVVDTPAKSVNLKFKDLFPPTKTSLTKVGMDKRTLILHSILLLLLSLEHYNAASRILLLNLTSSLKLPLRTFEQDEYVTAKGLLENAKELTATEETKKKAEENQEVRKQKVKYATIAGAAIIGVAGGFAAPLIAAGIGSVASGLGLGTTAAAGYLGSVASSSILVGSLFGAYGGKMTGEMMDKYAREVEDFEFLPVHSNERTSEDPTEGAKQASEHDHKLRVTICLSGWLTEKEEVIKPWRVLGSGAEVFALKYELEALLNLGHAMDGMVQSAAWGYAQKELIQQTIFADLMAAMWPLGLMKVARVLDNPFSVAKARAEKVGEVLADALINRAQGERPVTLIGYSLGARAIYVCLQSLAKRRAFNLIENAVLIGAPTPSDTSDWRVLRSAVSGRLVNVYSKNDYVLGFMYRTSAIQYGVAGLQPVEGLAGVENVDASEDVDGHLRYRYLVGGILKKIGFEDIDMEAVAEEQEALKKVIEEEKKNSLQAQRKRLMRRESYKDGKVDEDAEAEVEASEMEKQVKERTQQSLVTRIIQWWYTPRAPNTKDAQKVAGNLAKAAQNPSDAGAAVTDTVKDAQNATASVAQRVYQALPNIPYMSSSGATGGVPKADAGHIAGDVTKQSQSYTSRAAEYLPSSMPSMPSMPAMPSMPNIPGYSKKKETASKPAEATKDAGEAAKNATDAATDTVGTTVKNAADLQNNPATKQLKEVPGIKQAVEKDPGVTQGLGKVTGAVSTTVTNTTDKATGATEAVTDKAGQGGGKAVDAVDSGSKKVLETGKGLVPGGDDDTKKDEKKPANKPQQQSYTSKAASYLPSIPSWRSSGAKRDKPPKLDKKSAAPKLDKKTDEEKDTARPAPPKLERKDSSQVKETKPSSRPPPPKLDRSRGSQQGASTNTVKSPPPKLGPRKASERGSGSGSGAVSTATDTVKAPLEKVSSGVKDPKAAASSSTPSAETVTNAPKQALEKGSDATGQVANQGQQVANQGKDAITSGASTATEAPKQALSKGSDAAGQVAGQGQKLASSGAETVTSGAGQAASQGQKLASSGAETVTSGAGQVAGQGQKAASQGKEAVSSGASAATGAVGGAFGGAKRFVGFGR